MNRHTPPNHPDYSNLCEGLQAMEAVVAKINQQKRLSDTNIKLNQITSTVIGSTDIVEKAQVYFGEGILLMKDIKFSDLNKVNITEKQMECVYIFLFPNFLMKAKKISNLKPSNFVNKNFRGFKFSLLDVIVLDNIKEVKRVNGNDKAFVLIEKDHTKSCYMFSAESIIECNNWLSNFMGALKYTEF